MRSLFLALAALAGAEPTAPVAPEPPRFEMPALAPLVGAGPSTATRSPTPTPTPAPARVQTRAPEPTVLPPSLTAGALRDELRASSRRRQEELAAIAREREELEKLSAEIATARAALEAETARLDEKVKKVEAARSAGAPPPGAPGTRAGGRSPGETLAKALKGMKAEQAAALVTRLERRLAVDLLRQMRPADAGGVLEKMKPETAAELFALMASHEAGGAR